MYNFRDSALGWVNVSMRAYMYISLFTEDIIPTGKWQREKENKKKKKKIPSPMLHRPQKIEFFLKKGLVKYATLLLKQFCVSSL